jgi:hypothetical protein
MNLNRALDKISQIPDRFQMVQILDCKPRKTENAIPYHTTFFWFNLVFCLTT